MGKHSDDTDRTAIWIGTPEHAQRLAWRDSGGYRDGSRYDSPYALAAVKEQRIESEQQHNRALEAGGYTSPYEHLDDVYDTDPAVVGYDHIARDLLAAEHLLEAHRQTKINLCIFGGVSDLVDWALDYSGVSFGWTEPTPSTW